VLDARALPVLRTVEAEDVALLADIALPVRRVTVAATVAKELASVRAISRDSEPLPVEEEAEMLCAVSRAITAS
jgi:hypothetical protein